MTDAQLAQLKQLVAQLDTDQQAYDAAVAANTTAAAAAATANAAAVAATTAMTNAATTDANDVAALRTFIDGLVP